MVPEKSEKPARPRRSSLPSKLFAGMLIAGLAVIALAVVFEPNNVAEACGPFPFTDSRLAELFAGSGMDGLSWETAYVFSGNVSQDWRFLKTTRCVIIRGCIFNGSEWGVDLWESAHTRITNCTFVNARKGIIAREARDVTVSGCTFANNARGIDFWRVKDVSVQRNDFSGNALGILASSSCNNVTIRFNSFDIERAAIEVSSASYAASGNFYGDYFANHPAASFNASNPAGDYCNLSAGAAFPLSVPVDQGLGRDLTPLWLVPNVTPAVTIANPGAGSATSGAPVIEVDVAGTLIANASVEVNGTNFALALNSSLLKTGRTPIAIDGGLFATLVEGSFTIVARATSWFNVTGEDSVAVIKDTISPVPSFEAPTNGSAHALPPVISIAVIDATPCKITCEVNGINYTVALPTFTVDTVFWNALPEGDVAITLLVTDAAGNAAPNMTLCLQKDVSGPTFWLAWISGNSLCGKSLPEVNVTASDPSGVVSIVLCTIGSDEWDYTLGTNCTIPREIYEGIPDGPFTVTMTARDTLGNPTSAALAGEKDTVFDTLEILTPLAGAAVSGDVVPYFAINATDRRGVVEMWVSFDFGLTRFIVPDAGYLPADEWARLATPGSNITLTFGATDAAGNTAMARVVVAVANIPVTEDPLAFLSSPFFWGEAAIALIALATLVVVAVPRRRREKDAAASPPADVMAARKLGRSRKSQYRRYR